MTKVAVPIKNLSGLGGLEKDSWYCALSFARAGCDVTVLTTGPEESGPWPHHESITIKSLGARPFFSVLHIRQFDKSVRLWLRENPQDIVFGLDQNTSLNFFRAGNGSHAMALEQRRLFEALPKRLSFALNPLHQTILGFERRLLDGKDLKHIFTNSQMIKDDLLRRYPLQPERIDVVYNGVEWKNMETSFSTWQKDKKALVAKCGLHENHMQLVYVGSGFARKGVMPLLKAFTSFKNDPIELSIVGKDKNQAHYEKFVLKTGMAPQVRFFGARAATPFYQLADWCCIPSFYDPCANVTLEALAMGVPVISSKFNGGHELLKEGRGLNIENLLDSKSVARAIREALPVRKTPERALQLRTSMRSFEFENQFVQMVTKCLETI